MDNNLAILLLMAFSIAGAVALVLGSRLLRFSRPALSNDWGNRVNTIRPDEETTKALSAENEQLRATIGGLEERLKVLERIATDPAERVSREIEELR